MILGVVGAVLVVVGITVFGLFSNDRAFCSSSVGALAQGLSHRAAVNCTVVGLMSYGGIAVAAIGALSVVAFIALAATGRGSTRRGTPPGWYQPEPGSPYRWWDGRAWRGWWDRPWPPWQGP